MELKRVYSKQSVFVGDHSFEVELDDYLSLCLDRIQIMALTRRVWRRIRSDLGE